MEMQIFLSVSIALFAGLMLTRVFKKMGLNNFDMLSTDFIYRYLEKAKEV